MATSSNDIAKALRQNLLQAVKLYNPKKVNNFHRDMAGHYITSKQQFEEIAAFGGLSMPQPTAEFESPPVTEQEQIYNTTFKAGKIALQLRCSEEAWDDEQPNYNILRSYGTDMAGMFHQRMEQDAADVFMNTVDTVNGPDGVAQASGSHPLESGTDSNILSSAETVCPEAIRKMRAMLAKTKAHKGNVMPIMGPIVVEVSADNYDLVDEIASSRLKAQEVSNTTNVQGQYIARIIGNPYFINAERFCVRIADDDQMRRFLIMRKALSFSEMEYDQDAGAYKVTGRTRYIFGRMGWRGEIFSLA